MRKMRKSLYICLFVFVLIANIPTALCSPTAPTVFVSANGNGDYNCDGVKDEIEINNALQYVRDNAEFHTVYLLDDGGENDYIIQGTIEIGDDTTLTGDVGATVKLVSNFNPSYVGLPMVTGVTDVPTSQIHKQSNNVTISKITFDSDRENQQFIPTNKKDEYPTIAISGVDLTFHDLSFTTGLGDFIRVANRGETSPNLNIYDNYFGRSGHCGVYVLYTGATGDNRIWIHDNVFSNVASNAGVRLDECSGALIENNTFTSNNGGDHAIYVTYKNTGYNIGSSDNEIRYNTIHNTREYGILLTALAADGIVDRAEVTGNHIHHNLINNTQWDDNGGGINVYAHDALIESNTIVGCEGDGISTKGYLIGSYQPVTSTTGFIVTARNNIITGMIEASGHGYGINNVLSTQHTIISEYNNIYDNSLGNYNGANVQTANDLNVNPMFVTNTYSLDAASPLIAAGESNGNRVDIGRYGNTAEASMSADEIKPASAGDTTYSTAVIDNNLNEWQEAAISTDEIKSTSTGDTNSSGLNITYGTATIDGDLNEWQNTTGIEMYGASDRSPDDDNTAIVKAMYDDTYLYFAYDVNDTNLQADRANGETDLHLDDSIELYIDTLNNNETAMQTDDYHFIVNINGAVIDNVGTGTGKDYNYTSNITKSVSLQGTKNDANDTDTGYIIEVAIPWTDIGGKTSDNSVGLLLAINDLDNSGDVSSFNCCNLTGSYAVPESWGDANITGIDANITGIDANITGIDANITGIDANITGIDANITDVMTNSTISDN